MGDVLLNMVDWMAGLPPFLAYCTILGVAYLENVIPPIPGDMIVVFGGYMAGLGLLNPWLVVLLSTIGGSLGFMTMYLIGFKIGNGLMDPDRYTWLPKSKMETAKSKLDRWGFHMVAANRFLSGLRSVISLTVGMGQMDLTKTTLWCTLSALVWTAFIAGAGYYVGDNWEIVGSYLRTYGTVVTVIIVVFGLLQGIRYLFRVKKGKTGS